MRISPPLPNDDILVQFRCLGPAALVQSIGSFLKYLSDMILNYLLLYWTNYASKVNIIFFKNLLRTNSSNIPQIISYFQLIAKRGYFSAKGIPGTRIVSPAFITCFFYI